MLLLSRSQSIARLGYQGLEMKMNMVNSINGHSHRFYKGFRIFKMDGYSGWFFSPRESVITEQYRYSLKSVKLAISQISGGRT